MFDSAFESRDFAASGVYLWLAHRDRAPHFTVLAGVPNSRVVFRAGRAREG